MKKARYKYRRIGVGKVFQKGGVELPHQKKEKDTVVD